MRITVQDDFDLRKIADSGQCFRVREWDDDTFRFITGRDVLYLQQTGPDALEADCPDGAWERVWARYFDLGRDYAQVRAAIPPSDAWMRHAAEQGAGIRILRQDAWETLVTFILSQRKRIPAIKSCVERLSARFGERVETARETLYAFPSAAALAAAGEPELDECGLGYRTPFVRAAAEAVASGALSLGRAQPRRAGAPARRGIDRAAESAVRRGRQGGKLRGAVRLWPHGCRAGRYMDPQADRHRIPRRKPVPRLRRRGGHFAAIRLLPSAPRGVNGSAGKGGVLG